MFRIVVQSLQVFYYTRHFSHYSAFISLFTCRQNLILLPSFGSLPDSRNTGKNAVAFIAATVVSASTVSTRAVAVMLVASTCIVLPSISTILVTSVRLV